MANWFWHDGAFHHDTGGKLPKGAQRVPRAPEAGEGWDAAKRQFVRDAAAAHHELPVRHIETAHLVKSVEASLILSGVTLTHGLIAEEAAALGIDALELAQAIHDNQAGFRTCEIARRTAKKKADQ